MGIIGHNWVNQWQWITPAHCQISTLLAIQEWIMSVFRIQVSKIELFMKIVNVSQTLTILAKSFILDIWMGSEYVSVYKKAVLSTCSFLQVIAKFRVNLLYLALSLAWIAGSKWKIRYESLFLQCFKLLL